MSDLRAPDFPSVNELGGWLPQYEIRRQTHTGHDHAIFLGRQTALDRAVVIELIPEPPEVLAVALQQRLRRRARLVHPLITAVFDFGRTPAGQFYLVMEHVGGQPLATLIEEGQLKPKTAFPLALELCEALQILHDQQMPHGALDVHSIWVTPEGHLKLTGIGMTPDEVGDLAWLRPFRGSLSDDIRALGTALHWMFARCAPAADGRLSRDLPPAFASVLRRALDTDVTRQFAQPSEVASALKEALRGEQDKSESATTRSRMVVAPGAKQPAPAAPVAPPPPKLAPGHLQPVVRHYQPTFFQRMDAFVWKAFSTGLHVMISLLSVASLILLILFKDKIVIEKDNSLPMATVEEMEAPEKPIPAEVLGSLPPVQDLPTASSAIIIKPITVIPPPPKPPVDPLVELRAQYVTAVQEAANQALEKVRLDDLPHLQRELQLLQSGGEIPAVDEPNLPASLKILRQRYREVRDGGGAGAP